MQDEKSSRNLALESKAAKESDPNMDGSGINMFIFKGHTTI